MWACVQVGRRTVRQHVNPLSNLHQRPVVLPEHWVEMYFTKKAPFVIDVGCAKGTWLRNMAEQDENVNYLGLEIRKPLVEHCLYRIVKNEIKNAHVLTCNANVDLKRLIEDIKTAERKVKMVCFHHPDPWFKKKHMKRAVVTEILARELAESLQSECHVFVQSDVLEVLQNYSEVFINNDSFAITKGYNINTLEENEYPHEVVSKRAIAAKKAGKNLYRIMFTRK